ncbi:hypothetical protein [Streptomyces sp. NPDC008139]|uniref:hypothetical protein n=1 Tax=Streptomyces sp. NPDC008139 TaxID=3364814 RepID=UPI0036E39815
MPGLKTPDDGRRTFPPLALLKPPAGKPGALDTGVNPSGRHYADLRSLLLPLPEGAVEATMLPGVDSKEGDDSVESGSLSVPVPVTVPVTASAYAQTPPYDDTATRYAFVHAGDTPALVVRSTGRQVAVKRGTPAVPFRQTVRLQAQLLG